MLGTPPPKNGELFANRYEITRVIGRGGYADVYLAKDLTQKKAIAIKIMHAALMRNRDARMRFQREAHVQGKNSHQTQTDPSPRFKHRQPLFCLGKRAR